MIPISSSVKLSWFRNATFLTGNPVPPTGAISIDTDFKGRTFVPPLYTFTSHTFTNCGQIGMTGPTLTTCTGSAPGYGTGSNWWNNQTFFDVTGPVNGIQKWKVPKDGNYEIDAYGARAEAIGTVQGGHGARIKGTVQLTKGEWIHILVGQIGYNDPSCSAGGGGTFVIKTPYNSNASILIIAGGGGGVEAGVTPYGGVIGKSGGAYTSYGGAQGGTNGYGGIAGHGQPGAGFLGDATGSFAHGGTAAKGFVNGGKGGDHAYDGGFGGGGGCQYICTGGGGGYSGGASGDSHGSNSPNGHGAGGGGSYYDNATNVFTWSNNNNGPGKVIITFIP